VPESVTLVVPCFNEARRLDAAAFLDLVRRRPGLTLLFVDDGSTDGTAEALERLRAAAGGSVRILRQDRNGGKAEAVRAGLAAALEGEAPVVGYADADLATSPEDLLGMMAAMDEAPVAALLGSRVRLLGRRIERRAARHYLGRVFASVASLALGIPVYDTQCGAKLFLGTGALESALRRPFRSRWIFDVELLDRLLSADAGALSAGDMREHPLHAWRDVPGSSLRPWGMIRAGLQLLGFAIVRLVRRRAPVADPRAPAEGEAALPRGPETPDEAAGRRPDTAA
jgi:glycosyltransferase involved in cell wall biosynthesis